MSESNNFISLLILIVLALIAPIILRRFKRLRIPIVVGEIAAGIVVGRSGLNLFPAQEPVIHFLSEFGLVYLMFLAGMEIDFSSLGAQRIGQPVKNREWNPFILGLAMFVLTLLLSTASGFGLLVAGLVQNPWMMALILSTTSLGVVVPVLKETGLVRSRYGQTLLVAALIADFVTMLLITILVAILSIGLTPDLLLIGVLFAVFIMAYRFGLFFNRIPGVRKTLEDLSHATAQIKVRFAFAIMMTFVVLSQALGTEVILGAFLAGAIISLLSTPADSDVASQLETIGYGFLIPIFFITVGIDFDLAVLFTSAQDLILVPVLTIVAILVKLLPALLLRTNFSLRESFAGGALLSSRLSLIIAASAIGTRLNVISPQVNSAIILVAILTVTISPLIFIRFAPSAEQIQRRLVLISGAGELGIETARQLQAHKEEVMLLDPDKERVKRALAAGIKASQAAVEQNDSNARPYLEQANRFICTYADPERSFSACSVARHNYGIANIVAHLTNVAFLHRFENIGVTAVNPALDLAAMLVILSRNPATYSLLTRTNDEKDISEVLVENEKFAGKTLRQIQFPGDVLILALRRNGELIVPHGNTRIETGDFLTLVGGIDAVQEAQNLLART